MAIKKESKIKQLNDNLKGSRKVLLALVFLGVPSLILVFTAKLTSVDYCNLVKWLAICFVGGNVAEHLPMLPKKK